MKTIRKDKIKVHAALHCDIECDSWAVILLPCVPRYMVNKKLNGQSQIRTLANLVVHHFFLSGRSDELLINSP